MRIFIVGCLWSCALVAQGAPSYLADHSGSVENVAAASEPAAIQAPPTRALWPAGNDITAALRQGDWPGDEQWPWAGSPIDAVSPRALAIDSKGGFGTDGPVPTGVTGSLSRLGAIDPTAVEPAPITEAPAAVPLPGGLAGGAVTLAALAMFHYIRRRPLSR